MKLLVVEPSILLRERLVAMLASFHFVEIVEATTVDDACQVKHAVQPEIVVMGAQLPDKKGVESLARIKSEYLSACLVVITPYASELYSKRWLQAGADHCLDLSVQIEQLLNIVMHHSSDTAVFNTVTTISTSGR